FPLTLVYTITIYKAQGITLDRTVANLAVEEFIQRLFYIAYSRVTTLEGLIFKEPFKHSLLYKEKLGLGIFLYSSVIL
ncbi:hypothetical protein GQ53DRAFT_631220, partial [Thozetella sp. PMI_491]